MIGMDVDEGELTETGRIRQPVEHLGGLTRRAHPAEAQALTVIGPVDDEGRDRCLLVGEVRRPGGGSDGHGPVDRGTASSMIPRYAQRQAAMWICAIRPASETWAGRNSELGHGLSLPVREADECECVGDDVTGL
jgi:hypothetical protein